MPFHPTPRSQLDLEREAAALAKVLGGRWTGAGALCRCPAHDDRSPSLSIRIGHSALLFKCFAGCERTDVLRAIASIRPGILVPVAGGRELRAVAAKDGCSRWSALVLWQRSVPLRSTLAEDYLRRRALTLCPDALRFHPRTPLGRGVGAVYRPALIAALHEGPELVAVQRTFLEPDGPRRARDLGSPRRLLGRPRGGAVLLAPACHRLGLAEGVETALSAMILFDIPVWAALGAERFAHVRIPESVTELILLPDNDRAGRRAEAAARSAHARPGRVIRTWVPPAGFNDWNDVLRAGGKEAGRGGGPAA